MNHLEIAVCKSVKKASKTCIDITGHGLYDAPESLFQSLVGMSIGKSWYVLFEASRKKIALYHQDILLGRPPKRKTKYDFVVWNRAKDTLRAVIELKRATTITDSMRNDAKRIKQATTGQYKISSGYLLVYSYVECSKGYERLISRFDSWASELDLRLVCHDAVDDDKSDDGWIEAFALMRVS